MPITDDLDQQTAPPPSSVRRMLELRDPRLQKISRAASCFAASESLINPSGIFADAMKYALSIKTVVLRKGAKIWYDDQKAAHNQIYNGDETVAYPSWNESGGVDNRWLREAMENQVPLIYSARSRGTITRSFPSPSWDGMRSPPQVLR